MTSAEDQLIAQALRACDTLALTGPRNLRFNTAVRTTNGLATGTDPNAGGDRVALEPVHAAAMSALADPPRSVSTVLGHSDLRGPAVQFCREQNDVILAMATDGSWDWDLWDQAMQFVNKPELTVDRLAQTELLRWVLEMFQLAIPLVPSDRRAVLDSASALVVERLTLLRWSR
jgi:hypothetical protein